MTGHALRGEFLSGRMPGQARVTRKRNKLGRIEHAAHSLVPGLAAPAKHRNVGVVYVLAVRVHGAVVNIGHSGAECQRGEHKVRILPQT